MTDNEARRRATRYDGAIAAIAFSGAAFLLAGQALPVRFVYRENQLGIVSIATLQRYPIQQETFWLVFSVGCASLVAWLLAVTLRGNSVSERRIIGLEALGAVALLAALWIPPTAAAALLFVSMLLAIRLAKRQPPRFALCRSASPRRARRWHNRLGTGVWLTGTVILSMSLVPALWRNAWNVAHHIPDVQLTYDSFRFHGETGQHLAWALELVRGGLHGRDFFCLYGPLYDWSVVGLWALLGRSIATWNLYWTLARVVGWAAFFLLAGTLVRRSALVLLLPLVLKLVSLRIGIALFALLFTLLWLRSQRSAWLALAGATTGVSLLYSQEYGIALLAVVALALAVNARSSAALVYGTALAAALAPVAGYYAAHDALGPMLRDLAAYPGYVMSGYAKIPFPAIESRLLWDAMQAGPVRSQELRIAYALPAVFVTGLLLAFPISALDPGHLLTSIRIAWRRLARDPTRLTVVMIAVFGLITFRSALGRSDRTHFLAILPSAALLIAYALDRIAAQWSSGRRALSIWRLSALALFLVQSGFTDAASPVSAIRRSLTAVQTLARAGNHPVGNLRIKLVATWIREHTDSGDSVLFLPNNAAYYYLTDRRNPIRFVLGSQIVTEAHRREVLADLTSAPPRYVVWDDAAARIDGLSDELVFGGAILDWIDSNYVQVEGFGEVRIMGPRALPDGTPSSRSVAAPRPG